MTADNQTTKTHTTIEETNYSKATSVGRNPAAKATDKTSTGLKTLSLRPTKSFKKNDSFKPTRNKRG